MAISTAITASMHKVMKSAIMEPRSRSRVFEQSPEETPSRLGGPVLYPLDGTAQALPGRRHDGGPH